MSVTPDFVGQRYKDTNTGNIWIANSTTPGDWTLEVQDLKVLTTPRTLSIADLIPFCVITNDGNPVLIGVTSINLTSATLQYIAIGYANNLLSITGTVVSVVDEVTNDGNAVLIFGCQALQTISFPNVQSTFGPWDLRGNPALVSISLPSLVTADNSGFGGFNVRTCPSLTTIDVPLYFPENGDTFDGRDCALNASTVNLILARHVANPAYVSGGINLSGGTNAAPSGQGIADKATLNGRSAGLCVTN